MHYFRPEIAHAVHAIILGEFERFCRTIAFNQPRVPFISNVSGTWITDAEATDPAYWVRHLRSTVLFADGVHKLTETSGSVFCEIGIDSSSDAPAPGRP